MPRKSALGKTGVFWDLHDCRVPMSFAVGGKTGLFRDLHCPVPMDSVWLSQKIKSAVAEKGCRGKVSSISTYGRYDRDIIPPPLGDDSLCFAGIRIVDEGSIVDRMQKDILLWALENKAEPGARGHQLPNLVVIAASVDPDSDFGTMLGCLKSRYFNVVAVLPNEVASPPSYANSVYLWSGFFHHHQEPIYQTGSSSH